MKASRSDNFQVRSIAAQALSKSLTRGAMERLLEMAQNESDRDVQRNAIIGLVGYVDIDAMPQARHFFVRIPEEPDSIKKKMAVEAMAGSNAVNIGPVLIRLAMDDPEPEMRKLAAKGLNRTPQRMAWAYEAISYTLRTDKDGKRRWRAAIVVQEMGTAAHIAEALIQALADEDWVVREAARVAIVAGMTPELFQRLTEIASQSRPSLGAFLRHPLQSWKSHQAASGLGKFIQSILLNDALRSRALVSQSP